MDISQSGQELRIVDSEQSCSSFHFLSAICRYDSASDCCENESTSFLDLLLDIVIKLDFPEKLVTFLLQLLPNQEYKVCTYCMYLRAKLPPSNLVLLENRAWILSTISYNWNVMPIHKGI